MPRLGPRRVRLARGAAADLIAFITTLDATPRTAFLSQLVKLLRRYGTYDNGWLSVLPAVWKLAEKFGTRTADVFEFPRTVPHRRPNALMAFGNRAIAA